MADTVPEVDALLEQLAEARAMVRMARARLHKARQRAERFPGYDGDARMLLRREFQRLVLGAEDGERGNAGAF